MRGQRTLASASFAGTDYKDEEVGGSSGDAEMVPIIRIKRAQLTPCPKPPNVLEPWLTSSRDESARYAKSADRTPHRTAGPLRLNLLAPRG